MWITQVPAEKPAFTEVGNPQTPVQLSRDPVKLLIWAVLISGVIWIAWSIVDTLLIFSLASLMAYLLAPAAYWFSRKKIPFIKKNLPWGISVFLAYLLAIGGISLIVFLIAPGVAAQTQSLISASPGYWKNIEDSFGKLRIWYHRLHISPLVQSSLKQYGAKAIEKISPAVSSFAAGLAGGIFKVFSALIIFLLAILVSLYILLDLENIKSYFFELFPGDWKTDTKNLSREVGHVVGGFIRGNIILSFVVAAASYIGLLILNLFGIHFHYALLAALVAGLMYPIPFLGFWIPRLLAPIVAFFQPGGWSAVISVFAVLTGIGLAVDYWLSPKILGGNVGISPLMVLLVVFAGGELLGIWGLLLAIPAAAILRLLFIYLRKRVTI